MSLDNKAYDAILESVRKSVDSIAGPMAEPYIEQYGPQIINQVVADLKVVGYVIILEKPPLHAESVEHRLQSIINPPALDKLT